MIDPSEYFNIEELRKHLKVYHEEDDDEIMSFCGAGLELAASYINGVILKKGQTEKQWLDENSVKYKLDIDGNPIYSNKYWLVKWNYRIKSAVLLCTSDLYENREANTDYETYENRAFGKLLDGMRNIDIRQV